ncbi:hypothetical protein DRH13_06475 [Candidatus Woesebacteria bacterium]|nr:MAG: hypothetical protein DRH13_06475 [Candidatus Woesebacteria bacterium]
MNKIWTDSERNFIKVNAATMKDRELAVKLSEMTGRKITIQAVRKQRQKMGIQKAQGRGICSLADDTKKTVSDDIARVVTNAG